MKKVEMTGERVDIGRLPVDKAVKEAAEEAAKRAHRTLRGYMAAALDEALRRDGYLID